MTLVAKLLLNMPIVPLILLIIFAASGLSVLGLMIVRRLLPSRFLKAHHEVTNPIFQVLALAYTVFLAFVVVVSWQNYDKANAHIESEANNLVDLHRGAAAFPQLFRDQLHAAIKDYVDLVVNEEWPLLPQGEESYKASMALRKIWDLYTGYEPKTEKEKAFFAEATSKLDDLREMRRLRLIETKTGLHPVLRFILILGGIAIVGFAFLFGADSFSAHAVMVAVLSVLIALILFLIFVFDFPFTGSGGIGPETFQKVIHF